MMFARWMGAACMGIVFVATPSRAQSFALGQLEPAPAGDTFFGVPSARTSGHLVPRGVLIFDYAHRPFVASLDNGGNETAQKAIVSAQAFLHFGASVALADRLLFSASFPIALIQRGDSPTIDGTFFQSPSGAQAGDLRLGARIRLFGEDDEAIQMATGLSLHLPTAPVGAFTGDVAVRLSPELLFGGKVRRAAWAAAIRPVIHGSENPSVISYGAAIAFLLWNERLRLGPEFSASTPLQDGSLRLGPKAIVPRGTSTNAEIWLGVRAHVAGGLWVGAAAGPGFGGAIGTPAFRAMGLITWSPEELPKGKSTSVVNDADGDRTRRSSPGD